MSLHRYGEPVGDLSVVRRAPARQTFTPFDFVGSVGGFTSGTEAYEDATVLVFFNLGVIN